MTGAIARLKASKENFKSEAKKLGYEWGLNWAMNEADYDELFKLAKSTIPETLYELRDILTDDPYIYTDLVEDGTDTPEFIEGFFEAALEVLNEVDA
jgi:hypothetical protein